MMKYQYGNDQHRAISNDEIIKLLSQLGGATVKTVTDILAVNANNKTQALVSSNLISSQFLSGITAGRAPRIFFKSGTKLDIDRVLDGMNIGYVMWYLRQMNLLTTSVEIDKQMSVSTYLAYKFDSVSKNLLRIRIIFWGQEDTKGKVNQALLKGYCPVIVVNSNEKEYCFNELMDIIKDNNILVITIKQRQNAKYLNSYLVSTKGIFAIDEGDKQQFETVLSKLKSYDDTELYDDIIAEYEKSKLLKKQHLPSLFPDNKRGDQQ
ncbi:hypothetical protein [Companilactobacillus sp. FL22-1]|uniref:hypothetical protein n=1 Tax=Companilactobacillus sp. FL22-1 TaxID=3373892 RepID=UPI0037547A31